MARRIAASLAASTLRLSGRRRGVVVVYHALGDGPAAGAEHLVAPLPASAFRAQVRLLRSRYDVVPAARFTRAVAERRRGGRIPVAITFDDDLRSHVELAAPILAQEGVDATFYLCGASLERPHRFWWERLAAAWGRTRDLAPVFQRYGVDDADLRGAGRGIELLSAAERERLSADLLAIAGPDPDDSGLRAEHVAQLARSFSIGFHTLRHDPLTRLDDAALERGLRDGRERLEQAAGRALDTLAYPHGDADDRVAAAARDAGFAAAFTTQAAAFAAGDDAWRIGRLEPATTSIGEFAWAITRALVRS